MEVPILEWKCPEETGSYLTNIYKYRQNNQTIFLGLPNLQLVFNLSLPVQYEYMHPSSHWSH